MPRFSVAMPPLGVDFSRRGRAWSRASVSPLGLLLLLAGMAVAAAAAIEIAAIEERADAAFERVESLRKAMARPGRKEAPQRAPGREEIRAVQKIAAAVAVPWGAVLSELETATGKEVALLTLDAEAATRTLRLSGEAASAADAFAYVERLGESAWFDDVSLVSHEERQSGARTVFFFTVAIVWSALP